MDYFYFPDIDASKQKCTLPKEEAKHIIRVLRKKEGDKILLTNGKGLLAKAIITLADAKHCEIFFEEIMQDVGKKSYSITMAVAPTKNNSRYEWFLEKATEIGVDAFVPLLSFHSERKNINKSRLENILVSAMKQSQKTYLPQLTNPMKFSEYICQNRKGLCCIAHCYDDIPRESIKNIYTPKENITVLIGPEGDFSKEEVKEAMNMGYKSIHLGDNRLRTETAGIVACSSIYLINQTK